jgi:hypothetical protein
VLYDDLLKERWSSCRAERVKGQKGIVDSNICWNFYYYTYSIVPSLITMVAVVASLPVKAKWTVIFTPYACLGSKATLAPVRKPSIDCGLIKLRTSLTMYQVIFFVTNFDDVTTIIIII